MGRQDKITPDIIEWLVSDDKVVNKWKQFARRLNLEAYVPRIDENYTYRRKKFEKQKMKELLDVWRRASPITFTTSRLMDVLNKEGLTDMHMWLQLMSTENSPRRPEISQLLSETPSRCVSSASNSYHSLPASPYSWFFDQNKANNPANLGILKKRPASEAGSAGYSSDYQFYLGRNSTDSAATTNSRESTPDSLSRPLSRLSVGGQQPSYFESTPRVVLNNKPVKSIRFADDLEAVVNGKDSERSLGTHREVDEEWGAKKSPIKKGADQSVEKYFDNLISMIEDAAEGL